MAVEKTLTIRPETIESIFDLYQKDLIIANRKYQRKLVWNIEEKEAFIDSIAKNFPVPLILAAEVKFNSIASYEIIDGLQRLDAIISFLKCEFHLDGNYFDLESIASTKYLKDTNFLEQKEPKLDRELCKNIASYQVPLTVTATQELGKIEEIFRRINSYGKHLSRQEIRQSSTQNKFSELVRKISATIRTDDSHSDRLKLSEMKKISINNKGLKYGIAMSSLFWFKNGIITPENIRESRDEELVAHILAAILTNDNHDMKSYELDRFYGISNNNLDVGDIIEKFGGLPFLQAQFEAVFQEIRKTIEASGKTFRDLLYSKDIGYVHRSYFIVFLAFYELLVKEGQKISDYGKLANSLSEVGNRLLSKNADDLRYVIKRKDIIKAITGIMKSHFVKRSDLDPAFSNGVLKLESILNRSRTENTNYDFKIGFHTMYEEKFNDTNYKEIIKRLCAMANRGKGHISYIVIGVADNENHAKRHKEFYKQNFKEFKTPNETFYITGVDGEALKAYKKMEDYKTKLESDIKNSPIVPEYYKTFILKNLDLFNYYDKTIILLTIESMDDPIKFEGKYYQRLGDKTDDVKEAEEKLIWRSFIL